MRSGTLLIGAALAAGAWWLFRKKKPGCLVEKQKLDLWGTSNNYLIIWTQQKKEPPTLAHLVQAWKDRFDAAPDGAMAVVVTSDDVFWHYDEGKPVKAPELKADYCQF